MRLVAGPCGTLATGCRDGNFSTTASLAKIAASSANERRAARGTAQPAALTGARSWSFDSMVCADPSPQLADLRSGLAVGRELGDAKAGAQCILVVDALDDIGERERAS